MSGHIWKYSFGVGDAAAATVYAPLPPTGIPDVADLSQIPLPKKMRLIGLTLVNKNSSGDTLTIAATQNGTTAGTTVGPTLQNTNALKSQNVYLGPNDAPIFQPKDLLGLSYVTTTGGTYTVNDVYAEVVMEDFDD